MNEQQIPKLTASLVEHQSEFYSLPTDDAQWIIQNTKKAIALFVGAVKNRPKAVELLLEYVNSITNPTTNPDMIEKFVVRDHFVKDTSRKASVKISYLGDNFKSWFFDKVEELMGRNTIYYRGLLRASVDGPIITELGGEGKIETTLAEMFHLMELQADGKNGALLNNGYANIFYIRDKNGVLRAVGVGWGGGGWDVDADSVERPLRWDAGDRVFSRIPVAA